MGADPGIGRRLGVVLRWPVGMAFTSWRYLWRITPLHRTDEEGSSGDADEPPVTGDVAEGLQGTSSGYGPLFHRRYWIVVAQPRLSAQELIGTLARQPDLPAPSEVAVFWKTRGDEGELRVGDEFVVRMPGPWDGPIRVVDHTPTSFRLATMPGHLEAGQIEFRAHDEEDALHFEIESWTRGGDQLSALLYNKVRLVKEMQLHMWAHYCERIPKIAGGRVRGGLHIQTRRFTPQRS